MTGSDDRLGRPRYTACAVPRSEEAAQQLRKRTLINLYDTHLQWLANGHAAMGASVAALYGRDTEIGEDDALGAFLALNFAAKPVSGS